MKSCQLLRQLQRSSGLCTRSFFDKANRDWDVAWKMGLTPWDLKGTVVPAIKQAVEDGDITPEKYPNVLIPGCGSGYECFYLREQGFPSIKGIDLSQTAIEKANKILSEKNLDNVSFEQADFFALPETKKYDFIFDYLFFAALDHDLRSKWAGSMQRCLSRKGVLATLIFPLRTASDDPNKGPPYPVELGDYEKALVPLGFTVDKIIQDVKSIKPRQGRELMVYWKFNPKSTN